MRTLIALALVGAIAAPANAQQASQLPVDAGICSVAAGGVALVTSSTGIGALPAAVLVTVCAIAANDLQWHLDGGKHVDSKNECRPIPDSNAQQGDCG